MGLFDRLPRPTVRGASRPKIDRLPADQQFVDPLGGAGTTNYRGLLIPDEYNADLRWPQSIDVWERMRRSDSTVREALLHITAPIMAADRVILPPEEPDDLDLELQAFAEALLFDWLDQPFPEFLHQACSCLAMGHSLFETVYKVVNAPLRYRKTMEQEATPSVDTSPAGDPILKDVPVPKVPDQEWVDVPARQFVVVRKFMHLLPSTISEWQVDTAGDLTAIKQRTFKVGADGSQEYNEAVIPSQDLLVFVHEKWGDEWPGHSILRAAYKPWTIKEMLERVMGIAFERHGVGIPVAYIPRDREDDKQLIEDIQVQLRNLRAGEFTHIVFPGPKSTGNTPGFQFEVLSPGGQFPDFRESLEYLRAEIKGALLVRFSELGHGQAGARATASTQAEVWYAALEAFADLIATEINRFLRRMIDLNYPEVTRYPTFAFTGLKAKNLLEFAQAVALLTNAQVLHPDTPTREWVRTEIDAPLEDTQEAKLRADMQAEQHALTKGGAAGVWDVEEDPAETARPRTSKSNTPD